MHLIPVIDIRHGQAVRAVAGDRANYQPLTSPLAPSPDPLAVARAYRALHPFDTLYVADLDAIEGRDPNGALIRTLAGEPPPFDLWVDAGQSSALPGVTSVVGSETLDAGQPLARIAERSVLSLDFRGDAFSGPAALLQRPELWPSRVIVMTLARVGTQAGPDFARIAEIAALAPQAAIYAAGGIRDIADLRALRAAGASGALIASALHAQKIKADDLDEIVGL